MKKYKVIIIFLWLFGVFNLSYAYDGSNKFPISEFGTQGRLPNITKANLVIEVWHDDSSFGVCNAVALTKDTLLTSAHCLVKYENGVRKSEWIDYKSLVIYRIKPGSQNEYELVFYGDAPEFFGAIYSENKFFSNIVPAELSFTGGEMVKHDLALIKINKNKFITNNLEQLGINVPKDNTDSSIEHNQILSNLDNPNNGITLYSSGVYLEEITVDRDISKFFTSDELRSNSYFACQGFNNFRRQYAVSENYISDEYSNFPDALRISKFIKAGHPACLSTEKLISTNGLSGSPLYARVGDKIYLIGVLSQGNNDLSNGAPISVVYSLLSGNNVYTSLLRKAKIK